MAIIPPIQFADRSMLMKKVPLEGLSANTPCIFKIPLNEGQTVLNIHGTAELNKQISILIQKCKIIAMIFNVHSKYNPYLTEAEKLVAESGLKNDFFTLMADNLRELINLPEHFINQIVEDTYHNGTKEAAKIKTIMNTKAAKRYIETAKSIESIKTRLIELEEIFTPKLKQIENMKHQYYQTKDVDLARQINDLADDVNKDIAEYNRLLAKVYAPKVTQQKEDIRTLTKKLNNCPEIQHLDIEDIFGKTPRSPRDRNFNIIK